MGGNDAYWRSAKARLLARFKPMATLTMRKVAFPPEKVDVVSGNAQRDAGRSGFPPRLRFPAKSRRRGRAATAGRRPFSGSDAYYSYVLTLFGQGWDQHRFAFTVKGELLPDWGGECVSSR